MPSSPLAGLPKVLLHDHLDGGVRASTVVELAGKAGYDDLPSTDPEELLGWFVQEGASSLESYLEAFKHTFGVMQDAESLHRVAYEAAEDLAADGVVYAESRFAPSLHLGRGLTREEAIEAVVAGFEEGRKDFGIPIGVIVDAMRQHSDSVEVAEAAVAFADRGVVAFDLAGPEEGYPASDYVEACRVATRGGLRLTIHAGEGPPGSGAGLDSIREAIECGAERIGHGLRLIDDVTPSSGDLGEVATIVRDRKIALEQCPTSNIHIKAVAGPADHPIGDLYRVGIPITVNTDNRLMSGVSLSDEFQLLIDHQGFELDDLKNITLNALDAAFCSDGLKVGLREKIQQGFA
jgi:adenosine deaminase